MKTCFIKQKIAAFYYTLRSLLHIFDKNTNSYLRPEEILKCVYSTISFLCHLKHYRSGCVSLDRVLQLVSLISVFMLKERNTRGEGKRIKSIIRVYSLCLYGANGKALNLLTHTPKERESCNEQPRESISPFSSHSDSWLVETFGW